MMKFAEPFLEGLLLQLCVALIVKSALLSDTCQENSNCSSDRAVCLNFTCVCVSGVYDPLSDTCDSMPLYPFGVETNDKEVDKRDDTCSPAIDVPYGIPVHKQTHTQLFVCTNGLVSFTEPYTAYIPPTNVSGFGNNSLEAPFYVDINIARGGNVFYRIYSGKAKKTDIHSETVARIESFISTRVNLKFPLKTTFILVATWAKVAPYNESFNYAKRSTFQLVLATDGFKTFALFIYGHGLMTWEQVQNPQLWIGYWAGEEFKWSHQDSFKSEALLMDKQARFEGIMGLLVHSLTTPESHCKKWYEDYKDKKDEITEAEERLPQCPCNMDGLKPNHLASRTIPAERNDSDSVCVDLLYANASTNRHHGKSCCYNTTTRLMIREPPNAGGFYQYHPKEYPTEHANYDRYSRKYCCELSDLCRLYYELHPVGDCYTLACREGTYGPGCNSVCSANCVNGTCDSIDGNCTDGCVPGYTGRACNDVCPNGFYGDGCLQKCGQCRGACEAENGTCPDGCLPCYHGSKCLYPYGHARRRFQQYRDSVKEERRKMSNTKLADYGISLYDHLYQDFCTVYHLLHYFPSYILPHLASDTLDDN